MQPSKVISPASESSSQSSSSNQAASIAALEHIIPAGTTINISILGPGSQNSGEVSNNVAAFIHNTYNTPLPVQLIEEQKARGELILHEPLRFPSQETDALYGEWPGANEKFAGRQKILEQLKISLRGGGVIIAAKQAQLGVVGTGGVGKTQVAAEYVRCCLEADAGKSAQERRYALIVWLPGSPILLDAALRHLASWLGLAFESNIPIKELATSVYARLEWISLAHASLHSVSSARVLLVLDDAQNELALKDLLPIAAKIPSFHWLITSRQQKSWQKYFKNFNVCMLDVFNSEEALDYFSKNLHPSILQIPDCGLEKQQRLAKLLGYLPLALAQAAAWLNTHYEEGETLASYCESFERQFLLFADISVDDHERTLLTVWLITLPQLLKTSSKALELLLACSYLSGESISYELLRAYWGDMTSQDDNIKREVQKQIEILVNYSLIQRKRQEEEPHIHHIAQHQLLQQVLQCWLSGDLERFCEEGDNRELQLILIKLNDSLHQAQPSIVIKNILFNLQESLYEHSQEQAPNTNDLNRQITLLPHFKTVIEAWKTYQLQNKSDSEQITREKGLILAGLLHRQGILFMEQGAAQAAQTAFAACLVIAERHYGAEDPEVARTLVNLGNAYGTLGDAAEQQRLLLRALPILERHYGAEHPEVARTLTNLGNAYGTLGDAAEQKRLLLRALAILERHYGAEHPEVAITLGSLGNAYGTLGDAAEQQRLLLRALPILERHYGAEHPEVAATLANLGIFYQTVAKKDKVLSLVLLSINYFQRALACYKTNPAYAQHPFIARITESKNQSIKLSFLLLCSDFFQAGLDAPAYQYWVILLRHLQVLSEPEQALQHHKILANLYLNAGHAIRAIEQYSQVLAIEPETQDVYHKLGCCYHVQSQLEQAEVCFQTGMALFPAPIIFAEYAHFLVQQQRHEQALEPIERCLAIVEEGELDYSRAMEYKTVLPALQKLIDVSPEGSITLSAHGLAYYLKVIVHANLQQDLELAQSLQAFEDWIDTQAEDKQSIFRDLLETAYQDISQYEEGSRFSP